uniref:Uncharacterized protein n=1 Tax=Cucumis sativus TaxID=3659 RepID=A0A0A0LDE3_CUCSA
MACLAALRTQVQLRSSAFSIARKGFSSFQRIAQSRLQSGTEIRQNVEVSGGEIGGTISANESEIIFIGTGTSEGIPRVSCLTDPVKKCPVRISKF